MPDDIKITIMCASDMYILDVCDDQNVNMLYSCRVGFCYTCAGFILKGLVDQSNQTFLDNDQIVNNFALTCVAILLSDYATKTHRDNRFIHSSMKIKQK